MTLSNVRSYTHLLSSVKGTGGGGGGTSPQNCFFHLGVAYKEPFLVLAVAERRRVDPIWTLRGPSL